MVGPAGSAGGGGGGAGGASKLPAVDGLVTGVMRRELRLLAALLPVVVLFSVWDIVGIVRDHWSYSPRFTSGWDVPPTPMPIEELVFLKS